MLLSGGSRPDFIKEIPESLYKRIPVRGRANGIGNFHHH